MDKCARRKNAVSDGPDFFGASDEVGTRKNVSLMTAVLLLLAILSSPTARAEEPPTFEADVLPVFNAHCLQCHGGVHQRDGLDLRTLQSVLKGGKSGPAVIADKPDDSLLWKKLSTDVMPKTDNKVSPANKAIVRAWIAGGAKGTARVAVAAPTRAAMPPAQVAGIIDRLVDAKLAAAKIPASPRADDAEFLRRLSLDIAGRPPTAEQARAFLDDTDPDKRVKLIDGLLASPDYGRHFAERWRNLFAQMSVNKSEWDPAKFEEWLAQRFNAGCGWDEAVRELFSTTGLLADNPQAAFYYYNADMQGKFEPKIMTGNLGQVFLGVQLQCAECHDHPFAAIRQNDFWGVAAFFGITSTPNNPPNTRAVKDNLPKQAPKPGSIVQISIPQGEARNAGTRVRAKFLGGGEPTLDPAVSSRPALAQWLTSKENNQFARAAVNRFWAHFFGRGFVNPLNDFGDHNAPTHPELLDALAEEFVAAGFDLRHLIRGICRSAAYQRSGKVVPGNESGDAETLLARMSPKVLTPEELHDALCVALEVPDLAPLPDPKKPMKKPNPKAPPPPSPRSLFVAAFRGPGEVDEPTELKLGVPHALRLMNQEHFNKGGKVVERLLQGDAPTDRAVEGLFLAALSRRPTSDERSRFGEFVSRQPDLRQGCARVLWVLINSSEFLLNR